MQIKMTEFYHGQLNGRVRWFAGEVHEVDQKVGDTLIERGKAVKATPKDVKEAKNA